MKNCLGIRSSSMENEQVPLHHISSQRRRLTGSSSSIKPFCLMVSYEFPPYGFIRSFAQIICYSRISAATDIYSLFQPRNFAAVWQSPFDINHFALMTNNSPSNKISIFSPSCLQSSTNQLQQSYIYYARFLTLFGFAAGNSTDQSSAYQQN